MAEFEKCPRCGASKPVDGDCLTCAIDFALGAEPAGDPPGVPPASPDRIGHYKLLRELGRGGFGVVYLAEQEEPIRRQVALKVIHAGVNEAQARVRFDVERQALAQMDHPNIAKVLDAGTTESGQPFFAMEYVEGASMTKYCDDQKLSLRQRLKLFMEVCQAVQHAHQKGIIHRDLKPSNILVSGRDGEAHPKVIDFGIAKIVQGYGTGKEQHTATWQQFLGTPAYMSPEQAGASADIDSRSDIYSLGVLLYELLTAQRAFDENKLREAAIDQVCRAIREDDPPKPSTRLMQLAGAEKERIAAQRKTQPAALPAALKGDLDWIVMKALEKQRERRYESATGFAADVRRHLEDEPVQAGPPSRVYRVGKWARRNRGAVIAAGAVALAVMAGLVVSTWQWRVARVNEKAARTEAIKSTQVAQFLEDMLKGVNPSVAQGQDTTLLRQILDKTARRLDGDLKQEPDIEADLRSVVGHVYAGLGDYSNAAAMYGEALAIRTNLYGPRHLKVADALGDLGEAAWSQGHYPEAEKLQLEALAIRTNLLGPENAKVAESLDDLGKVWWHAGKWPQAETSLRQSLAMRRKLLGSANADTVMSLDDLAGLLSVEDKLAEAESMQREALALNEQLLGNDDPAVAVSMNNLSDTLDAEGNFAEAEAIAQKALALRKRVLGTDHPDYAHALFELGNVFRDEGKLTNAESMYRQALAIWRRHFGETNLDVAGALNNLAGILINEGKAAEAEPLAREALAIQRKLLGPDHEDIAGSLINLAAALANEGKLAEAEAAQREAAAMQERILGEHLDVALSYYNLAFLLEADGKFSEAETNASRALALRQKILGNEHYYVATTMALLARIRAERQNWPGAEELQRQEVAIWRKLLARHSPPLPVNVAGLADALARQTQTLLELQNYAEAEASAREAVAFTEKELPEDWQHFRARSLLGSVLAGERKLAEAEPLLLTGYDGLARMSERIPAEDKPVIAEAIQRLVSYYQAAGQPAKAAEWKKKLDGAR